MNRHPLPGSSAFSASSLKRRSRSPGADNGEESRRYGSRVPNRRRESDPYHGDRSDSGLGGSGSVKEEEDDHSGGSSLGDEDNERDDDDDRPHQDGDDDKDPSAFDLFPAQVIAHEDKRVNGQLGNRRTHFGIIMGPSESAPEASASPSPVSRDANSVGDGRTSNGNTATRTHDHPPTSNHLTTSTRTVKSSHERAGRAVAREQDPVDEGLVTMEDAKELFELYAVLLPLGTSVSPNTLDYQTRFFQHLNPFICLFDPELHTVEHVRAKCPFLFTCLIMAGCKFWKRDKYKKCQMLASKLAVTAFSQGWKSVEVVQGFACMTYWKDPTDTVWNRLLYIYQPHI